MKKFYLALLGLVILASLAQTRDDHGHNNNPCNGRENPCSNGVCSRSASNSRYVTCNCTGTNYIGPNCQIPVNPCNVNSTGRNRGFNSCRNNATCTLNSPAQYNATSNKYTPANFSCACSSSYTGLFCEVPVNPCGTSRRGDWDNWGFYSYWGQWNSWSGNVNRPCQNNATCTAVSNNTVVYRNSSSNQPPRPVLVPGNVSCACVEPWNGPYCSVYTDPCQAKPCGEGNNTCTTLSRANSNSIGSFNCTCLNSCIGGFRPNSCKCLYYSGWFSVYEFNLTDIILIKILTWLFYLDNI
jgi:hypothetical protein